MYLPLAALNQIDSVSDGVAPHGGVPDGSGVRDLKHHASVDGLDTHTHTDTCCRC